MHRSGKLCVMTQLLTTCSQPRPNQKKKKKKIRPGLSRLSAANRWPMDLRWGRRRDMKKRLSIDSAGLVLFFFFSSPFSLPFSRLGTYVSKRAGTCVHRGYSSSTCKNGNCTAFLASPRASAPYAGEASVAPASTHKVPRAPNATVYCTAPEMKKF